RLSLVVFLSSLSFAGAAAAQDGLVTSPKGGEAEEAAAIVDDTVVPPEQEEALKMFARTWRCTGTSFTEYGADIPTTLTIAGKKDLGGRWLLVRTDMAIKTK